MKIKNILQYMIGCTIIILLGGSLLINYSGFDLFSFISIEQSVHSTSIHPTSIHPTSAHSTKLESKWQSDDKSISSNSTSVNSTRFKPTLSSEPIAPIPAGVPLLSMDKLNQQKKDLSLKQHYQTFNLQLRQELLLDWCYGLANVQDVFEQIGDSLRENPKLLPLRIYSYLRNRADQVIDPISGEVSVIDDSLVALYILDQLSNLPTFKKMAGSEVLFNELKTEINDFLHSKNGGYSIDETVLDH